MSGLFEKSDSLNTPIECFVFDAGQNIFPVKPHWHYFAEFIYMLDGRAEMRWALTLFPTRQATTTGR